MVQFRFHSQHSELYDEAGIPNRKHPAITVAVAIFLKTFYY